jgi:hypothetical protein
MNAWRNATPTGTKARKSAATRSRLSVQAESWVWLVTIGSPWDEGTAAPAAPTEALPGHVTHAELGQRCLVLPCAADVEDSEPAARTKYAHGFVDSFLTAG